MSPEERAMHYAALFTRLGPKWRSCVPCDGTVKKGVDRMWLSGVQIAHQPDGHWRMVDGYNRVIPGAAS